MPIVEAVRRRLYKRVEIAPTEAGFMLLLDSKPAMTPAKQPLQLPSAALADAIAAEWLGQGDRIDPDTMPMTRLASIALDLVAPRALEVIDAIANYVGTDLVCYRAEAPPELVRRQHAAWQPLVDWAANRFDAPLVVTQGILPRAQPQSSLAAIKAWVATRSAWELAALNLATTALGSIVLALALAEGRIGAEAAFAASVLDETFEIERWGEDAEQMRRRRAVSEDVHASAQFLSLLKG